MKNLTAKQKITSNSHSLRLRNMMSDELKKAIRENLSQEVITYYQREIDEINEHLDSLGFRD
jgi:hypothetical protein